jgi:hypothetical protein
MKAPSDDLKSAATRCGTLTSVWLIGLLGAAADKQPAEGTPNRETTALWTLAGKIEAGDHADRKRLADEIAALLEDVEDVDVAVAGSSEAAARAASTMADDAQSSFM